METLQCSRAEAIDIIKTDEEIEKGGDPFALTAEQKQAEKKMRGGARAVDAYGKTHTRNRPEDEDKRYLINVIQTALSNEGEVNSEITDIDVTNIERQIDFKMNNRRFRIVLSAPRK